jgi:hypothetical protein
MSEKPPGGPQGSKKTEYVILVLNGKHYASPVPSADDLNRLRKVSQVSDSLRIFENPPTCIVEGNEWDRESKLDGSKPLFYTSEGAYGSWRLFQAESADIIADTLTDDLDGQYSRGRPNPDSLTRVEFMKDVSTLVTDAMVRAAGLVLSAQERLQCARQTFELSVKL